MNPRLKQMLEAITNRPLNRKEVRRLVHRWCPCGSGKRYLRCCFEKDIREMQAKRKKRDEFYERMEVKNESK